MIIQDEFCKYYEAYLDGTYDCVDRIVLNAYFPLAQSIGGFRTMITAYIVLREKTLMPLLASAEKRKTGPKPPNHSQIDIHYKNIQIEMQNIFKIIGIAA